MPARVVAITPDSTARAAKVILAGGLVVYPTDTVYGLGCDPTSEAAVRRLFQAKGRESKPIPVLCSSLGKAEALVELSARARELAMEHWPGALTIVAPLVRRMPRQLTQGKALLGVRVPDRKDCLQLISACGGWLSGTSANRSGMPSARTAAEASDQVGGSVDLILDGGVMSGSESTVVEVVGDAVTLLRTGPVGVATG